MRSSRISPLHTHDETGIIHTESRDRRSNTLGQFFTEWGVELSDTCVGETCDLTPIVVYINGVPYDGDPAAIELTEGRVIVIAIGTPPDEIPSTADFSRFQARPRADRNDDEGRDPRAGGRNPGSPGVSSRRPAGASPP